MSNPKYYETLYTIRVLTRDSAHECDGIESLAYDLEEGDAIGDIKSTDVREVPAPEVTALLKDMGNDGTFFDDIDPLAEILIWDEREQAAEEVFNQHDLDGMALLAAGEWKPSPRNNALIRRVHLKERFDRHNILKTVAYFCVAFEGEASSKVTSAGLYSRSEG